MRIRKPLLLGLLAIIPMVAAIVWPARAGHGDTIKVATWNLEWLVTPETAHAARLACRNGQHPTLPCDVVKDVSRDTADLARLASYARELDADIVAFEEVENAAIASKVFGGYLICMADGPGLQHVGFAVRPSLSHRCGPVVDSVALDGRGRKAISMRFTPARGTPIELLAVHLKSGCSHDPLDSANAACQLLAQQATKLGEWIAQRSAGNPQFIVLGDFNRVPPQSSDDPFWQRVLTAPVELLATRLPFHNCFVGQPFSQYIDQILLSSSLRDQLIPASPRHSTYRSADVVRYQLSDHCPDSISLALPG